MAIPSYMTLTGQVQGLISAGCSTAVSVGNKMQTGHTDEIMVLSFLHDLDHTGNSKHATHGPVMITKLHDKSSPLLAQAMDNREELTCKIDFYRIAASGMQEKYYTVELKGAVIARLTVDSPHCITQGDAEVQEHLELRYQDIIWNHHAAGTSGYASWKRAEAEH